MASGWDEADAGALGGVGAEGGGQAAEEAAAAGGAEAAGRERGGVLTSDFASSLS